MTRIKEQIILKKKDNSLTIFSSWSSFLGFEEEVHQGHCLPRPCKMKLKL